MMGRTEAKGEVGFLILVSTPSLIPHPTGLAYSLPGSGFKAWFLRRVLPHHVDRTLLCSPSWQTPCGPGLWHGPWGGDCWVFCWGKPLDTGTDLTLSWRDGQVQRLSGPGPCLHGVAPKHETLEQAQGLHTVPPCSASALQWLSLSLHSPDWVPAPEEAREEGVLSGSTSPSEVPVVPACGVNLGMSWPRASNVGDCCSAQPALLCLQEPPCHEVIS